MSTFTVTNTNNSGLGSLRQSVLDANAQRGKDIINFGGLFTDGLAHTINLTGSSLSITDNLTIQGTNPSKLTIKDDSPDRVFDIGKGATSAINRLTITNTYDGANGGGAISNEGVLTLSDSIIKGNTVSGQISTDVPVEGVQSLADDNSEGGGIFNTGSLTVNHSTITDNRAYQGGGIFNTGRLSVNYSAVTDNRAGNDGGGIFTNGNPYLSDKSSITTVSYSTISGNQAGINGGGIEDAFSYRVVMDNSTITSNKAGMDGGGIEDASFFVVIDPVPVVDNGTIKLYGGGIHTFNTNPYTEYNSRIYNNSPDNVVSNNNITTP
ncbi:hypothetical protein [Nostoc sp.]